MNTVMLDRIEKMATEELVALRVDPKAPLAKGDIPHALQVRCWWLALRYARHARDCYDRQQEQDGTVWEQRASRLVEMARLAEYDRLRAFAEIGVRVALGDNNATVLDALEQQERDTRIVDYIEQRMAAGSRSPFGDAVKHFGGQPSYPTTRQRMRQVYEQRKKP